MKLSQTLIALAATLDLSAAAPAPAAQPIPAPAAMPVENMGHRVLQPHKRSLLDVQVLGGQTFRINQANNPIFRGPTISHGPYDLFRAYNKFGNARFGVRISPQLEALLIAILQSYGLLPGNIICTPNGCVIGGGGGNGGGIGGGNGDGGDVVVGDPIEGSPLIPDVGDDPNDFNSPNFSGTLPDDLDNDDEAGDVDAIPDRNDKQFLCPVQIGNPPQTLNLNFDTGSSDLWVFSTETPANLVNGQTQYDPTLSSTSQLLDGQTWEIQYGDGSGASGGVYLDTVTIGGITVENQAVEVARQVSGSFAADEISDGLVGLGFNTINQVRPTQQNTFWQNALETLAMPLFSANLKSQEPGNYNFGFIDPTEFTGDISFIPVNSTRGFWEFTTSSFQVGDGPVVNTPHLAMADTGTTLMLVPDEVVIAYYSQVPGAQNLTAEVGGFTIPCNAVLPDFTARIGDYEATVPGEFINFAPADNAGTICFGGLQSQRNLPFAIYGAVFLKSQFVVFHGGQNEIGLANKPLSV